MANRFEKNSAVYIDPKYAKAINYRLGQFEKKYKTKSLRKGLRAGAKVVHAEAVRLVPVGRTKMLKKALKVKAMKRKKGRMGFNVTIGNQNFVGKTFYGGFVNWGTRNDKGQWMIKPREFMDNAYRTKDKQALDTIISTLDAELERIVKEVA